MNIKNKYNKIIVLCFHSISDNNSPAYPPIPVKVFERLIKFLKNKYTIISINDIEKDNFTNKNRLIISFDDAFSDFKENALPILIKYKLPSVLNAITSCLDTGETFWTQRLNKTIEWYYLNKIAIKHSIVGCNEIFLTKKNIEKVSFTIQKKLLQLNIEEREKIFDKITKEHKIQIEQPMLNWNDIEYCLANNVTIGNHTLNHLNLTTLSSLELSKEIETSTNKFIEVLGFKPEIITFPNGQYNKNVIKECHRNGYKYMLTTKKNSFYFNKDVDKHPLIIPRIALYSNSTWKNILKLKYHALDCQPIISYEIAKKSHHTCLVCNSYFLKKLKGYEKDYLVKCHSCNFVFSSQIPIEQELAGIYEDYGRNDYLSPLTVKRYNELLDYFERYRKTNKILDVGCGIGYFLEEAKKRNWEVYGTEFTGEAVKICTDKGIQTKKGVLDIKNYKAGDFDIITSFEVIEHINNPDEEIKKMYYLLRVDGLLYITTPNFNSIERYVLKEKYSVIHYPEHLSYYTKKTLTHLLQKNSFRKLQTKTTGISITRIKVNKQTTKYIYQSSDDEKIRNVFEKNLITKFAKTTINLFLSFMGIGNTIKALYIKK